MNQGTIIATRPNKTIYRDGDTCVKLFCKGYSKADILNEALNQARIEEEVPSLHIPKVLSVTTIDGQWAIISQFIEGKTLSQLMAEHPERREEYLERLVDIQLSIQANTCIRLNRLKDKMRMKIDQTGLDATTRYDLHTRLESMREHRKVCHGDFHPSNVIITPDDVPYIIDWAHVTQGNASADVARTYLLFCLQGEKELAEKYLTLFSQKSDTARQYVQKWMPIVAASQSVKGNEAERSFLLRWVDVVEYQ